MKMAVACPTCRKSYQVPENRIGTQAHCKSCQSTFTIVFDETIQPKVDRISDKPVKSAVDDDRPIAIGHYEVQELLGAGAMGQVWLARDPSLDRLVAIKVLPAAFSHDAEHQKRFLREARSAAQLHHTNVATVYQAGQAGELTYIAMEYVDGGPLDQAISSDGPMDWREATRVIRDAARGLAAAHEMGLVHRDIKPGNLLRNSKGETKVVDFGLVRALDQESHVTQVGRLLGTPAYMAPEQWSGGEVDARTDLYSLTCTFYHLLTGSAPFDAPSFPALGYQHRYEAFPTLTPAAGFPAKVQSILERGSAKDPAERYQNATELIADLDAVLDGGLSLPEVIPTIQVKSFKHKASAPIWPDLKRHATSPRILIAAGVLFVCMLLGVIFMVRTPSGDTKGSAKRLTAFAVPTGWSFDAAEAKRRQEETAEAVGLPVDFMNSIGMKFRLIPPGEFMMGSPADEADRENKEGPQHQVRITQPFYLGIHEVTQGQYEAVMGSNPSHFKGSDRPVEQVSWDDAVEFCKKLSAKDGQTYRLLTEAEWEYACRAGSTTRYSYGDDAASLGDHAWFGDNSSSTTHGVGEKPPNAWGLYDMRGNVWEWCADWYAADYYGASPVDDPMGPATDLVRVFRGGGWINSAGYCRAAFRHGREPARRDDDLGFRVAAVPSSE